MKNKKYPELDMNTLKSCVEKFAELDGQERANASSIIVNIQELLKNGSYPEGIKKQIEQNYKKYI